MTIPEFIETAYKGNWTPKEGVIKEIVVNDKPAMCYSTTLFLEPEAWESVGKVKGWKDFAGVVDEIIPAHEEYMCNMIHALCNGKTLEEYIETL